ncbi:MAG: type II toxin-antitoxin system VapC family toxin [Verrucomicrobiales bacterium]|nr:type II toxin-antitoxin system VapC family toxin [Verrucomicrobiales bacterium]
MNYLLDTNAWLNLIQAPENISPVVIKVITGQTSIALSPISIVEVAQKQTKGKLELTAPLEEWVERALFTGIKLIPITADIACDAYRIPDFHGDPADRIIAATARRHQLTLITSDKLILKHTDVKTLSTRV